jgi:WS/DGAT/MGAT family acyltransferase
VALLDALFDAERTPAPRDLATLPDYRRAPSSGGPHPPRLPVGSVASLRDVPLRAGKALLGAAIHPLRTAQTVTGAGTSAARLLAPSGAMLSPIFTERGPGRHLDVHEVEFDLLHDAAARHGYTANDLFVAAVVEGAARYHGERSASLAALRVTMPMNIRTRKSATGGNQWVPARFRVPADIADPLERMAAVHDLTARQRAEPAIKYSHTLAGAVQMLPSVLSSAVVGGMMGGVDAVVTNVPGLSETRYLAGARVERMFAFAPTGGAAFNIALLSHGPIACFGLMSDTDAVADPAELHASIADSIDACIDTAETSAPSPRSAAPTQPTTTEPGSTSPTRLSALDVGFLQLETDDIPMHLGGVFVVDGAALRNDDGALRLDDIRQHVASRLHRVPAYLRRLEDVPFGLHRPLWVDDPDFDIDDHVRAISLEECVIHDGVGGDLAHAYTLCADINAERLDRSRPLWEIWLVDGLDDGRVVMLLKIHHALTDGVGAVELIAALFDLDIAIDEAAAGPPAARRVAPPPSGLRTILEASIDHLRDPVELARSTAESALSAPAAVARSAATIADGLRDLVGPDAVAPTSALNQSVGQFRTIRPIPLDFAGINTIRDAHGGSANDVALTLIAGGLRSWLIDRGDDLPELHALCPVSQREGTTGTPRAGSGGNHVGAMLIALPLGEADPVRRLAIIRERTARAKNHHDGDGVAWVLDAFDHLPTLPGLGLRQFLAHQPFVNLVVTNIPGPRTPLWFRGAKVETAVPVVPLGPNTALGIALFSYDGTLTIGLHADPERCPDLHIVAEAIAEEFDALQ